jgi:Pyruvate/2-oxoacid:ferredoxin oxidoreductase gamma subunit
MGREHYEMRFGGSGGQGMMLMGDVMAQAAGISEGREVVLLKSYGPEARGGACRSELIIDSGSINYPGADKAGLRPCHEPAGLRQLYRRHGHGKRRPAGG